MKYYKEPTDLKYSIPLHSVLCASVRWAILWGSVALFPGGAEPIAPERHRSRRIAVYAIIVRRVLTAEPTTHTAQASWLSFARKAFASQVRRDSAALGLPRPSRRWSVGPHRPQPTALQRRATPRIGAFARTPCDSFLR
jgi:hypothetical protein